MTQERGFRRTATVLALAASTLFVGAAPAGAEGVFNGVCTIGVTVDFFGTIGLSSDPLDFRILGSGSCTLTGVGIPPSATITFDPTATQGSSNTSNCTSIVAAGTYFVTLDNGVPDSVGDFTLRGNAFAAVMEMRGTNFTGVMAMTSTGSGCTGGVGALDYAGRLFFLDP